MHEEALLRDLMSKVEEIGETHPGERIGRIRLWVGALAHLSEPQIRERWTMVCRGTRAEGSRLEIEVSNDLHHPRATGIVLKDLDLVLASAPAEARP